MLECQTFLTQAVGVDVVDVTRLQGICDHWGERFLTRLFTSQELALCRCTSNYRWKSLAGRFAAKEATKKILAAHGEAVGWTEIEVLHGQHGEPLLQLDGRAQSAAKRLGYTSLLLSISHDAGIAIAIVIAT